MKANTLLSQYSPFYKNPKGKLRLKEAKSAYRREMLKNNPNFTNKSDLFKVKSIVTCI